LKTKGEAGSLPKKNSICPIKDQGLKKRAAATANKGNKPTIGKMGTKKGIFRKAFS